jgi:hypothetical protein
MKPIFFVCLSILMSLLAGGAHAQTKIKVMEVNRNSLTTYGIRLNQHINREVNPKALDAFFECDSERGTYQILLNNRAEDVFYDFVDESSAAFCKATQKALISKIKNNFEACLVIANRPLKSGGHYKALLETEGESCN